MELTTLEPLEIRNVPFLLSNINFFTGMFVWKVLIYQLILCQIINLLKVGMNILNNSFHLSFRQNY